MALISVDCFLLPPTRDVPNNPLPALHYHDVLPKPLSEESAKGFLTRNHWEHRGTWGHIGTGHFHPNTHECYGVFQGTSELLIGQIHDSRGVKIAVAAGDVIVLPAGTAHSSLESSPDYRYIGVYPETCPKWRTEFGKEPAESFRQEIEHVDMPAADPVYGNDGPLIKLWTQSPSAKL